LRKPTQCSKWLPFFYCCVSSEKRTSEDFCPDRRRRRRSAYSALTEAYSGLYNHLVNLPAMDNFLAFDLNKDE